MAKDLTEKWRLYREAHRDELRERRRLYFENNREREAARKRRLLAVNVETIRAAKNVPCADCGRRFPPYVMDFDHIPARGPKLFGIADRSNRSPAKLLAEMAKCEVVCANCHRIRTHSA